MLHSQANGELLLKSHAIRLSAKMRLKQANRASQERDLDAFLNIPLILLAAAWCDAVDCVCMHGMNWPYRKQNAFCFFIQWKCQGVNEP